MVWELISSNYGLLIFNASAQCLCLLWTKLEKHLNIETRLWQKEMADDSVWFGLILKPKKGFEVGELLNVLLSKHECTDFDPYLSETDKKSIWRAIRMQ